ncbi:spermidine synthase [Cohnella rhizosphaerae]|uniref:Class I SAM-dependent methyltransferase n=1 Tax=Cohnella rhizosphaerae TaxID=1457232 RepID=A0A9X4KVP6_9BACL|nr:class I SAM-dependent methyltransferase [Cohnella rhizosphaerae]MDG0808942.1 class I SAM-dependent methyltransferase [Cohnella rhizosphaerae]
MFIALLSLFLAKFPYVNQLALYALLGAMPFVLFGWCMGRALASGVRTRSLYAADLLGAGAGVAAAYGLIQLWGGLQAMFALSVPAFVAAVLLLAPSPSGVGAGIASGRPGWLRFAPLLPLAAVVAGLLAGAGWWRIDYAGMRGAAPDKTIVGALRQPGAQLERTEWDAFARADVVSGSDPARKTVFIDGGAGSYMYKFDGDLASVAGLAKDIEFLPFAAGPADKTAIVGAGGGRDILYALLAGAKRVTAVELSDGIVRAMREDAAYNGGLLDRPGVTAVVGDGRTVLARSGERYDLIALDLVYSQVGGVNGHALTENYAFTREAFRAYLERLNEGGRLIVISHQGVEGVRAFYTGLGALMDATGAAPATAVKHAALLMASEESTGPGLTLTVIQRAPLAASQLDTLRAGANALALQPLFLPGTHEQFLQPLIEGKQSFDAFVRDSDFSVYPTTDDKPFFYKLAPGMPGSLKTWLGVIAGLTALFAVWVWWREVAPPKRALAAHPARFRIGGKPMLVSLLVGVGYMCLQAAFIQKAMKYAGSPAAATAVVLLAMLVGGSLGSRLAGRRRLSEAAGAGGAALLIALLAAAEALWGGGLYELAAGARLALLGVAAAALGLLMGVPLPLRMEAAERGQRGSSPLLFAVNGIAGVWGSWLGAALALAAGLRWAFAAAIACYALVALLSTLRREGASAAAAQDAGRA